MTENMAESIRRAVQDSIKVKTLIMESEELCEKITGAARMIIKTYLNGGKALLCGNGGSASDAQHIEGELVGRFQMERPGLPAIALTANGAALTAIGNDYGYDDVFARQVEAQGREGDVFIGISTSGDSRSVANAFLSAKRKGLGTIGLLGRGGGICKKESDISIVIPSDVTARIQECHIMVGHILCELVEEALFSEAEHEE